ncbi:aKG-HExxH-type peptide beta-hydroxylase [Candidatus Sororendozoicomonas aggregata]|uniref:aKG-HExxH-type peptide beta-hydroxylase n=1 Tax=Candidatus Sororendozoicomonas aggregata TaxID=3073239 RepID=UPI002ECFC641
MNIECINWAEPNNENIDNLIKINLNELIESYDYLSSVCSYKKFPVGETLNNSIDKIVRNKPLFFVSHSALLSAIENDNQKKCHCVLDDIFDTLLHLKKEEIEISVSRFGRKYISSVEDTFLSVMERDHLETYGGVYGGKRSSVITPDVEKSYRTTLELSRFLKKLKHIDISHFDEISILIDNIILVESNGVNASSYLNILGMFFLRVFEKKNENWSRLAEHVVHESAHNLLYHIWYQKPVITDDEGKYYTPFRLDYRPLSGVYHAMFVLARTIYAFNNLIENSFLNKDDVKSHYNESNNSTPFKEKFYQTVRVLRESGKLTLFGEKLVSDCENLVNACNSNI